METVRWSSGDASGLQTLIDSSIPEPCLALGNACVVNVVVAVTARPLSSLAGKGG